MNSVSMVGNLGSNPTVRTSSSGKSVMNFNLAVDDPFAHRDDESGVEKRTDWIPVVVWGKQAENCAAYLQKGSQVAITGSMRSRNYEDAAGHKIYVVELHARTIKFLSKIKSNEVAAEA